MVTEFKFLCSNPVFKGPVEPVVLARLPEPCELFSKLLKRGLYRGLYVIGRIEGDTRSLDYSSCMRHVASNLHRSEPRKGKKYHQAA